MTRYPASEAILYNRPHALQRAGIRCIRGCIRGDGIRRQHVRSMDAKTGYTAPYVFCRDAAMPRLTSCAIAGMKSRQPDAAPSGP